MNLLLLSQYFLAAFCILYPLVAGSTRVATNQLAFFSLMVAGTFAGLWLLWHNRRGKPLTATGRLTLVCGGLATGYGVILLLVTYGPGFEILGMAACWAGVLLAFSRPGFLELACGKTPAFWLRIYTLWTFATCFLTAHQHVALLGNHYRRTGLAAFGACVAIFLVTSYFCRQSKRADALLPALVVGISLSAAVAVAEFLVPWEGWTKLFFSLINDPRPGGTFGHTNWFGTALCLALPLAVAGYFGNSRSARARPPSEIAPDFQPDGPPAPARPCSIKWLWLAAILVIFAALLAGQTRGAWMAAFPGLAVLVFLERRQALRRNVLIAGLLAVAAVILPSRDGEIFSRFGSLPNEAALAAEGSGGAGTGRFTYWQYAIRQIPGTFMIGNGLDTFDLAGPDAPIDKAHSIYLETAVTTGLPGLIFMLAFFSACFWRSFPPSSPINPAFAGWIFRAAWLFYLIQGIFIHDVVKTWPLLWLTAAVACSARHEREGERSQ